MTIREKVAKNKVLQAFLCSGLTLAIFCACTGVCFLLDYFKVNDLNFIIIYVLGILSVAVCTRGFIYSAALSLVSVFGYNFFFTEPRYTFHYNDKMYIATFVLMLMVGLVVGVITLRLKKKMEQVSALRLERMKLINDAEKEQLKATLLRSISHDLRTPLTTIKNGAEVLLAGPDVDAADKKAILSDISEKADWTVRLVENLLSLTRIDSEKLSVKKSPEALEEVVPQAVRNVSGKLGGRKIKYEMPKNILLVPMDATLIIQVIGNILENAIKHTADSGHIRIKVFNTGRNAVFRIANDGERIGEEDLPHIFDMYYTADDGKRAGVGLGLAISELIVKAHGGKISAHNTEKEVVFEFTLPMEEDQWRKY